MELTWLLLIAAYIAVILYFCFKPLPPGLDYGGPERSIGSGQIEFIHDLTWWNEGERAFEQNILDRICRMIAGAKNFVVIDMFLFNLNKAHKDFYLPTTRRLVECLAQKKQQSPDIDIFFITDPINNFYGSYRSGPLLALRKAGVKVIVTDVNKLRDRNYLYAGFWRIFLQWFGTRGKGWIPDPLERINGKITLRAFLKAINARANHRKLVVCDDGDSYCTMVSSANIHEASSWVSNIAFVVRDGMFAKDAVRIERAVARISGEELPELLPSIPDDEDGPVRVRLLTERKIRYNLMQDIRSAEPGDTIEIAMLFIADPALIRSLCDASNRGVEIHIILDQNTQSFGAPKMGLPNQITAVHLLRKSNNKIRVYWWKSTREEFHVKLIAIRNPRKVIVHGGSANMTRRNDAGYSLEDTIRIESAPSEAIARQVLGYFKRIRDPLYTELVRGACKGFWYKRIIFYLQQISGITTY